MRLQPAALTSGVFALITTSSRILIHSPNPDELSALAQKLRDEGFRAIDAMTPRDVLASVAE